MFHCGEEVGFPDYFWEVFQVSPQENPAKAKQVSHYFPLRFKDFVIFLYRTKEIEQSKVDSETNSVYSALYKLVKAEPFQKFFLEYDAKDLSDNAVKDQATLDNPNDLNKRNEARFKFYAKWWSESNYLYPFILASDLEKENSGIALRHFIYEARNRPFQMKKGKLSIDQSQKIMPKASGCQCENISPSHTLFINPEINALKFNLYFGLYECSNIHLPNCVVINIELYKITYSFLYETVEYCNIYNFTSIYQILGNYGVLLKEFIKIAETIHFLHQRKILHRDITIFNILIFTNGNEITFKLGGFTSSETFSSIDLDGWKSIYEQFDVSSPEGSTSDFSMPGKVEYEIKEDWESFLHVIEYFTSSKYLNLPSKPVFNGIKALSDKIKSVDYWEDEKVLERVLEDIKRCLTEDIEACETNEPFQLVKKELPKCL